MKIKIILRFAILSVLILNISVSCSEKDESASTITSYTRSEHYLQFKQNTPTGSETAVISPLASVQIQLVGHYTPTKYIKVSDYNIHVFGTDNVSNWMIVHTNEMACNIVGSMLSTVDQQKFNHHHIFVITYNDPTIGTTAGQRNTSSAEYTIMNQVLVCATAFDTIRPDDAAVYRAWDTPIHEFGHSVDDALGIREEFA